MMLRMKRCVIYYVCLFILYTKTMTYSYPDSGNGNLPPYSYLQASFHQPYCLDRNEPGKEPPRSNKATRMYLNEFRGGGSSYAGIGRPANIDNNDEDVRSTRSSKFLGKDREVVHLNVDLKWIWSKITDRNTYLGIINHWWGIATKAFDRWSGRQEFKDICIDILLHIRSVNLDTKIRVFHGSIVTAARFAANTNRLLLLYIEDGDSREPSSHSTFFRNALSNSTLGNIINEKVSLAYFICEFLII